MVASVKVHIRSRRSTVGSVSVLISTTSRSPLVIVPVLSSRSVSTRASISTLYKSCGSAECLESLSTETASAVDIITNIPTGIMPIMLDETVIMVSFQLFQSSICAASLSDMISITASTARITVATFMKLLIELNMRDLGRSTLRAARAILSI